MHATYAIKNDTWISYQQQRVSRRVIVLKEYASDGYNFVFNMKNGSFVRWGKDFIDNPDYSPAGCEIADIEISTKCNFGCPQCYKSNTANGENMSFDTFKIIFDKLPKIVCQIAFGIGDIDANVDIWRIFEYCREKNVIPNVTINGSRMTAEYYDNLARLCGAVAVSHYNDDLCYTAVQELTNRGMTQVNCHQILCEESLEQCHQIIEDKNKDPRLEKLNAIVFLSLKPKGNRNTSHIVTDRKKIVELIRHAINAKVNFGFDSCFAPIFQDIAKDIYPTDRLRGILDCCEPCESFGLFSCYIDVKGYYFPCSFMPQTLDWQEGINMLEVTDFLKDVWFSDKVCRGRSKSLACDRRCLPYPEIYACLDKK